MKIQIGNIVTQTMFMSQLYIRWMIKVQKGAKV